MARSSASTAYRTLVEAKSPQASQSGMRNSSLYHRDTTRSHLERLKMPSTHDPREKAVERVPSRVVQGKLVQAKVPLCATRAHRCDGLVATETSAGLAGCATKRTETNGRSHGVASTTWRVRARRRADGGTIVACVRIV